MKVMHNDDKITRLDWLRALVAPEHAEALSIVYRNALDLVNQSVPPQPVGPEPLDESADEAEMTAYEYAREEYESDHLAWLNAKKQLEDEQLYARLSIKTLEEIAPLFGSIESELGHAFIWHISPQGEDYWKTVAGIYGKARLDAMIAQSQAMRNAAEERITAKRLAAEAQLKADEELVASLSSPTPDKTDHGVTSDEDADVLPVSRIERDSSDNQ